MTEMQSTKPDRVEIVKDAEGYTVHPYWDGVDRPQGAGWLVGPKHKRLAERLRDALMAGVVYSKVERLTDVNGKTYVHGYSRVMGRKMNADLSRLGF